MNPKYYILYFGNGAVSGLCMDTIPGPWATLDSGVSNSLWTVDCVSNSLDTVDILLFWSLLDYVDVRRKGYENTHNFWSQIG